MARNYRCEYNGLGPTLIYLPSDPCQFVEVGRVEPIELRLDDVSSPQCIGEVLVYDPKEKYSEAAAAVRIKKEGDSQDF